MALHVPPYPAKLGQQRAWHEMLRNLLKWMHEVMCACPSRAVPVIGRHLNDKLRFAMGQQFEDKTIGPFDPGPMGEAATYLHEFMQAFGICAWNNFYNFPYTDFGLTLDSKGKIDFLLIPKSIPTCYPVLHN